MSSEGSISVQSSGSRIRQFGLYRTIDARTEEFLRLSRKRQIRQGCACAAASTAITVTVVVVMFFVYEFSLNSETNLEKTLKSNWLTLMNDTSDIASFDSKLRKANIDRTTLKLLPLLIKAINKNAFLEKLLEDNQNASNSNEKKETTEKNVNDKHTFYQNWFKFPATKLYAIEYKSSPVVYYKTPTQNIEYYAKTRKIRDHQRIFNYVDKMISEKVYIGATRPILRGDVYTENPVVTSRQNNNPIKKNVLKVTSKPQNLVTQDSAIKTGESMKDCKCPHLGTILSNILLSIQKLIPVANPKSEKKSKEMKEHTGKMKMKDEFKTSQDVTKKMLNRNTSRIIKTKKDPKKVSGWYDSKQHKFPNFVYHQEKKSLGKTTELNNVDENDFPVYTEATHSIFPHITNHYKTNRNNFLKPTIDDSDPNRIYFNIFGPHKGVSSLRPNYLINNMDREMDTIKDKLNNLKKVKKNYISNLDNGKTEDLVLKKFFKSVLHNDRPNIITLKKLKQLSDITTKKPKKKVLIDDKLLLDFLKDKLDFSFTDLEDKNIDVNKMKTVETKSMTNVSEVMRSSVKDSLDNANTTLKIQKSNKTKNIHKSKENVIEHVINSTSLYNLKEIEFEDNVMPKIRHPKDIIKVIPKKITKRLEGTNQVLGKLTEKDIELLTGNFNVHAKNPENIIDKAVQKLLNKKIEFDVEWEDVDMDIEPNLITAKPNKFRSSYLQIGRTEGKFYKLRDDEFSDHIYYENINNNNIM